MAAGSFTIFNVAKTKLVDGTFDLDGHTWKAALVTQTWTPSATYTGTSTSARYSDIGGAEVANGSGYTTTGVTLTGVNLSRSGATVTWTANSAQWTSATITAKYIVIYSDTATNKDLLGFMDLETTNAAGISSTNGNFTINWNASGIFTLA